MRYAYRCNDCEIIFDVKEPMEANHDHAPCITCEQPCDRVWTTPIVIYRAPGFTLAGQAALEKTRSLSLEEDTG